VLVRTWQRLAFAVARGCNRLRLHPSAITSIGLGCSVAVPLVVLFLPSRWVFAAALLVILTAVADSADSGVALLAGKATGFGSFYDSMADRCAEIAWLVALWLLGAPGALVAACGALALLHEYARSRAALAGMPGVGAVTVAERPTRVLVVVGAMLAGAGAGLISGRLAAGVVTVALAIWLVLGVLGAVRLLGAIRAALR
jgi:CDP-diacylglycerol--glycerol-3-phosphate 3-phosphatidyltransferase